MEAGSIPQLPQLHAGEPLSTTSTSPPPIATSPEATCPRRRWKLTASTTSAASAKREESICRSWGSAAAVTSASTSRVRGGGRAHGACTWTWSPGSTAASDFFGEENVPPQAITMGVATILEAREVVLLAMGEHKADVVRRAVEGEVHADVAATFLQQHPAATVYLDPAAAAGLTRIRTPWLVSDMEWTPHWETEAVIWLSRRTGKPILHLATDDYREHHLGSLVSRHGSAEPLNGQVFNALISKIRGKSRLPRGQEVLVFSPHPRRRRDLDGRAAAQAQRERQPCDGGVSDIREHRRLRPRNPPLPRLHGARGKRDRTRGPQHPRSHPAVDRGGTCGQGAG